MAATPMMEQYLRIKEGHPDALLFYRMGDFYELFFEDAEAAAATLDIALTTRGSHEGAPIPMCGVPVHSSESYLLTLIRSGHRVAICEQMEAPEEARKRGSKSVVRREVVRLVTPGTLTEDALLEARAANHLATFAEVRGQGALAWADVSTGAVSVTECDRAALPPELARLAPTELVVEQSMEREMGPLAAEAGAAVTPMAASSFDSAGADRRLRALYGVASLAGFGEFTRAELGALGALAHWLEITGVGAMPRLRPPRREGAHALMRIDAATRRGLEIARGAGGSREGSLLWAVDRTVTAGGARLLERRLGAPSRDAGAIGGRLDAAQFALEAPRWREEVRGRLRAAPDMERAATRLAMGRGGPRDLGAIRDGLAAGMALAEGAPEDLPEALGAAMRALTGLEEAFDPLDTMLVADPGARVADGGFVADGVDGELDEARVLAREGRSVIASMQAAHAEATGIASLKIRHNNVLGYFVEVTAKHADRMLSPPLSETFIHRQTTASAVRFTTLELSELESRIVNAGARALEIERRHFERLAAHVGAHAETVAGAADALARIDVACATAEVAEREGWTRPVLTEGREFEVRAARHPVVERALKAGGEGFVPNDCDLSQTRIRLVTGPNMAGKSTFLRQNALLAVLAQAGLYVPAESATIGMVSALFSRVGASDDLARGRSTFMVEMVETAAILNGADDRALVVLDEIGRGTATWDGLSIAWAVLEHLHEVNGCRCLFATHYHELAGLAETLEGASCATMAVREAGGEVHFLHEVRDGAEGRSYGVQVAKLAGLPEAATARATEILARLEQGGKDEALSDLPLFTAAPPPPKTTPSPVIDRLREATPDALSPREALDLIYELRGMLEE